MDESSRPVTFVVPGDLHLTTRGRKNYEAALCVIRDANELIDPDFVQFIGDNVQDATDEQFQLFKELTDLLEVPHFVLVGDHDICGDANASRFRDLVGEPYGSAELRQFRFVRLNTLEAPPLGFTDGQLSWLEGEFEAARTNGQSVILFQHHYPYKVCENFAGPGILRWRGLVNSHRPVAVVCGHTHYHQIANDGSTIAIAARSIGDPEGGAPGYLVGHAQDGDFAVTYRTIDDLGPLVLVTHPRDSLMATEPRHVVDGLDELRMRVWSNAPVSRVSASLNDEAWFELHPAGDGNWTAPLDGRRLPKGEHRVSVEAHASDGGIGRQQVSFFADPTRRFTAVPTSRPVVRTTAFC